jgi:hypothetical protein
VRAVVLGSPSTMSHKTKETRGPVHRKAKLTVLDGPGTNVQYDILTRDLSHSGVYFLLKDKLDLGTTCRVDLEPNGHPQKSFFAEVTSSRQLSTGRFEMAVQFRKQL